MGSIDVASFVLGAVATLGLVLLLQLLRRDVDPTRTSGNAIASSSRRLPALPRRGADQLQQPSRPALTVPPSARVGELLRQGRKLEAIKLYREQTGAGLAQAKDAVEALEKRYVAQHPERRR